MHSGLPLATAIILMGMATMDSWFVNLIGAGLSAFYALIGLLIWLKR